MISANNPRLSSWIEVSKDSDFPIQNIPFGVFRTPTGEAHCCTRIGNKVIDLFVLADKGILNLDGENADMFKDSLNQFIKKGKKYTRNIRNNISVLFSSENLTLKDDSATQSSALFDVNKVEILMPVVVGDYTDFYSSREHAFNVGTMFRGPENALKPNWKHLPVAYHGRASSILPSGVPIHRPKGQMKPDAEKPPVFGACKLLDFELETAFITHQGKPLGESISTAEAEEYIFGMVIFNDWSARDIQTWEYVPLGPFLAKNFASSISPWIVTLDALEPYKVDSPEQDVKILPYLEYEGKKSYDINLSVEIEAPGAAPHRICLSNHKYLYWNMAQQLAHHTVNGCNINAGDMMASGTISGKDKTAFGSMLELSWRGKNPLQLSNGETRSFINDGDTVIMKGWSEKDGIRVGFGEVSSKLLPAL